jgi:seryl-tRNA synthetase
MKVGGMFATVSSLRISPGRFRRESLSSFSRLFSSQSSSRPLANGLSLDPNFAGNHPEIVIAHLTSRGSDASLIESAKKLTELTAHRKKLILQGDKARHQRKTFSKEIGMLMKAGKKQEAELLKQEVEVVTRQITEAETELHQVDMETNDIFITIPNMLDDRVPDGKDDTDNMIIHSWKENERKVGEGYLWHDELAVHLGGLDHDAATRIAGARFSVLVGPLARLERALVQYFLDFHAQRGYTEVSVPYIVSRSSLQGTGQLPKFEDDLFQVNHKIGGEDAFLIPTAEVPVTNLFRDQILEASSLPLKIACHSPSFRAEAGSSGKDTRGLLRQHQFQKVELVKFCKPEESQAEHEALTKDAEALLESLNLPYRRLLLCSGDTGFSARICYDLEVWLPGQQAYREISSCSNCYDFQARRMMLRYRDGENFKGTAYAHTINGSGVAVGRALIAVLENYQLPDGSVEIPEVLQPYMNNMKHLHPLKNLDALRRDGSELAKVAPYHNSNMQGNDHWKNK